MNQHSLNGGDGPGLDASALPTAADLSGVASPRSAPEGEEHGDGPGSCMILAIGTSAANVHPLVRVLNALAAKPALAVVLAFQQREALDEEQFKRGLGDRTSALVAVADGDPVVAGRIYLSAPNLITTLEEGRLRTRPAEQDSGDRGTIDSFFVSMAQDQDGNTIGLVLGNTLGDGTLGVAAIKEAGGLTMADDGDHVSKTDLVSAGSPAALVDLLLPIEEIPERIALHARHHARLSEAAKIDARSAGETTWLAQIAAVLREKTGHDFHGYKRGTFLRRVQRRMQVGQVDKLESYLGVLRAQPEEALALFNDLLIGVTRFFRDRREFEFLEAQVIPKLFEGKARGDDLRVWVLGCSTGEEAYSIAIILSEHAAKLQTSPRIQIFASDIDGRALAAARVGRYKQDIAADVTPERLARWFVKEGTTYCIAKRLRELCIFSQHSIVKDPPFSRLDLVSCRNLLIYLDSALQSRVIPLFHFALRPDGYLFLGNSENVSRHPQLFKAVDRAYRVFRKLQTDVRVLPDFRFSPVLPGSRSVAPLARPSEQTQSVAKRGEDIVERYAPAYAVVDEYFDVLQFSTQAGRFIHPAGGAASLNLPGLVHGDLRSDLRGALHRAASEQQAVRVTAVPMHEDGERSMVNLLVEPIIDETHSPRGFVVLFQHEPAVAETDAAPPGASPTTDGRVRRLEAELRVTRERLQTMIEELESTNEELKSSNEEYQSLNEELQSANEELETSKEELQSINEEVTTVNSELAHRVQELGTANSDLKNLLESTQIATVFLDNDLRVTNFTPAVTDIFPLVEADLLRPIEHIKSRVNYHELEDDVRRVIRTLGTVGREVENPETQARYIARVMPYRSVDNFIGGAVLTFLDVTPLVRVEQALRDSEGRLRTLMEGIPQLVWRAKDAGRWTWSGPQWTAYTGLAESESLGLGWMQAVHPDDRAHATQAWQVAVTKDVLDTEYRLLNANEGRHRWFQLRGTPVRDERGNILEWLGTSTEIDDQRRLQEEQKIMVAELQHRTRNLITVIRSIANQILRGSDSLGAFRLQFNDSLDALSRVQGLLSKSGQQQFTFGALLRMELDALGASTGGNRVFMDGPDVPLRKSTVQTLALALHELATNACKYGALATEKGRLRVTWSLRQRDGEGRLRIEWVEDDFDRPAPPDGFSGGYGRKLIEQALPYALDAETSYELTDAALRCTIELPMGGSADPSESE